MKTADAHAIQMRLTSLRWTHHHVPTSKRIRKGISLAGLEGPALQQGREEASLAAVSAFGRQRAFLHQAGSFHGQGGALGEHMAPLGKPLGGPDS